MKRIAMHRALAVILLLAMLIALPAMAATTQVIATGNVNVRSGPGTNYTKLGQLKKDEVVISTGTTGDWTQIEYKDGTAYVSSTYVSPVGSTGGSSSSTSKGSAQATGNVNVRKGPGTNFGKLGQLKKGDILPYTALANGWYEVEYKDGTAYVSAQYMRTTTSGGSTGGTSTTGTQMEALANVNVRSGPSTKHSKLGQLKKGQTVAKTGVSSNWVMIDYNGKIGYVRDDYLIAIISSTPTPTPTATVNSTYVTAVRATTIRSTASASARAVGYMDVGDKVTYLADEGLWYKVQLGGTVGYVYYSDVTKSGGNTLNMTTVNAYRYTLQSASYYADASTGSTRIGTLAKEQNVYVQAANSTWAKCTISGQTVYVQTIYLSGFDGNMTVVNETRYTMVDNTPYYASMSDANRLGLLPKNTSIRVTSVNSTWAQCYYNSNVVYIQLIYLTDGTTEGMVTVNEYRTTNVDAVPYYLTASTSGSIAGRLNYQQSVYVNALNNTWARCSVNGQTVYVYVQYLTAPNYSMTTVSETWTAKANNTPCYPSPNAGVSSTGMLSINEEVKVTGKNINSGWLYGSVKDSNNNTVMVYVRIADMQQKF